MRHDDFAPFSYIGVAVFSSLHRLHSLDISAWVEDNVVTKRRTVPSRGVYYRRFPSTLSVRKILSIVVFDSGYNYASYVGHHNIATLPMRIDFQGHDSPEVWPRNGIFYKKHQWPQQGFEEAVRSYPLFRGWS